MADIGLVLRKQQSKLGEILSKKTHFSQNEAEYLLTLYRKLSEGIEIARMDRSRFREFLHNAFDMTDDILLDRIFKYFDEDNDGVISREEFILGLSVFLKGIYFTPKYLIQLNSNFQNFQVIMKNIPNTVLTFMI